MNFFCKIGKYLCGIILCVVLNSGVAFGQETGRLTLDPAKAVTQYGLTAWNSLDGLPQNTIGAIAQTPDGFIWLGTQEGLVQFDGLSGQGFRVFNRKNTPEMTVNTINQLAVHSDGALLVGTRGGGMMTFRDGRFSTLHEADGLSSGFSTALHVAPTGNIWFGTFEGGLNRISGTGIDAFGTEEGLPGRVVSFVGHTPEGSLLAGTDQGVFEFDGSGFSLFGDANIASMYVTGYLVADDGAQWFGTRDGQLVRFEQGQIEDYTEHIQAPGAYVKTIEQDVEGSIWFGSRGTGIIRLSKEGVFERLSESEGLSNNSVLSLLEDREGGLWVGTSNGLNRIQNGKFEPYTELEGLSNNVARSTHVDESGRVWICRCSRGRPPGDRRSAGKRWSWRGVRLQTERGRSLDVRNRAIARWRGGNEGVRERRGHHAPSRDRRLCRRGLRLRHG